MLNPNKLKKEKQTLYVVFDNNWGTTYMKEVNLTKEEALKLGKKWQYSLFHTRREAIEYENYKLTD